MALIPCRVGSSRLPGKSLMPILGRPMIERMIERVRRSRHIGDVMIATTELPEDQALEVLAAKVGVMCHRGSAQDVLGRMWAAAAKLDADLLVALLGDNPLVHADLMDDVIDFGRDRGIDYAVSVTTEYPAAGPGIRKFPLGVRVQVFPPAVLERCEHEARGAYYRENPTAYIAHHPDRFRLGYFEAVGRWALLNRPDLNFAVNYQKNFDLVARIFELCYPRNADFTLLDALAAFDVDPALYPLMGN